MVAKEGEKCQKVVAKIIIIFIRTKKKTRLQQSIGHRLQLFGLKEDL